MTASLFTTPQDNVIATTVKLMELLKAESENRRRT